MDVLCCYTKVAAETRRALTEFAPQAEYVSVAGSEFAYWRELSARWDGRDLALVEHDNVINGSVMAAFRDCAEPWCVFPYPIYGRYLLDWGLGCVRFRSEVTASVSIEAILAAKASRGCPECFDAAESCWHHIDVMVFQVLTASGFERHVHWPPIGHAHGKPVPSNAPYWPEPPRLT